MNTAESILDDLDAKASAVEGEYIPKDSAQQEEPTRAAPPTADLLYPLLRSTFNTLAPNWHLTDDEVMALAVTNGTAVDAWFPDGFDGKWAALVVAVATNFSIFSSRVGTPRKEEPLADAT